MVRTRTGKLEEPSSKEVLLPSGKTLPTHSSMIRNERKTVLRSLVIPDTVVVIQRRAMDRQTLLKQVAFPPYLQAIEGEAFASCLNLTAIRLPATVRTIGHHAFYQLRDLKTLVMSSTYNPAKPQRIQCVRARVYAIVIGWPSTQCLLCMCSPPPLPLCGSNFVSPPPILPNATLRSNKGPLPSDAETNTIEIIGLPFQYCTFQYLNTISAPDHVIAAIGEKFKSFDTLDDVKGDVVARVRNRIKFQLTNYFWSYKLHCSDYSEFSTISRLQRGWIKSLLTIGSRARLSWLVNANINCMLDTSERKGRVGVQLLKNLALSPLPARPRFFEKTLIALIGTDV